MPERISEGTRIRLFADDSILYRSIKSCNDSSILQKDLDKLQEWESEWKMEFHPQKCKVIQITNKRSPLSKNYTIHGETLEKVPKADYLGVTLDNKMSWDDHVDKVCRNANNKLSFLRRNLSTCPKDVKEKCYKTYVRPILEYAATVWDPKTKKCNDKIESVQRRACRFVSNNYSRTESVSSMLKETNWTPLVERRKRHKLETLFKGQMGQTAIPTQHLQKNIRKEHSFCLPASRINTHLYQFFLSTIGLWNSPPAIITQTNGLATFQNHIKTINISEFSAN